MKKHQFSFSNGEAKKRAKLDYKLLIRGEKKQLINVTSHALMITFYLKQ